MRPPLLRIHSDDLVVDSFAGGGGASLGIEWALGRPPDIAVNHDPEAIAMHRANHPTTRHLCEDVWAVDPVEACGGRKVALAWFSPNCQHFSKAKGGKPVDKKIRGLAWVVIRWARAVKPRVICLENVEEFQDWGPLDDDNRPDPERRGFTFRRWLAQLKGCGYAVEMRELCGCDYGAPTIRKRLFIVARCDGQPIVWPEPTHGPGLGRPYRVAAECIDWSLLCPSIFERERPLAEATLRRIARGIRRYVVESPAPFIIPATHGATIVAGGIKHALVAAFLAKHFGGPNGKQPPGFDPRGPMHTVTSEDHHALVSSHLLKLYGTSADGQPLDRPMATVTAGGNKGGGHLAEVRAFLIKYYGTDQDPRLEDPLHTVTTKDRFGLVTVEGEEYVIADIGMRMLAPRELFRAQGFPDSYVIAQDADGRPLTKTAQVRMCGNSVVPPLAAAIVRAQFVAEGAKRRVA